MKRVKPLLITTILALASSVFTSGALAHWADLAVAEISTSKREVRLPRSPTIRTLCVLNSRARFTSPAAFKPDRSRSRP
jgi:hypothetical protein